MIWGLTKKADVVHAFRNNHTVCPSKGGYHSWLFVARPDWNPDHPLTCKYCRCLLVFEEKERAVSPISPTS